MKTKFKQLDSGQGQFMFYPTDSKCLFSYTGEREKDLTKLD